MHLRRHGPRHSRLCHALGHHHIHHVLGRACPCRGHLQDTRHSQVVACEYSQQQSLIISREGHSLSGQDRAPCTCAGRSRRLQGCSPFRPPFRPYIRGSCRQAGRVHQCQQDTIICAHRPKAVSQEIDQAFTSDDSAFPHSRQERGMHAYLCLARPCACVVAGVLKPLQATCLRCFTCPAAAQAMSCLLD